MTRHEERQRVDSLHKGGHNDQGLRQNVHVEGLVVLQTDTVVDPRAVMVEALDAVLANGAVSAAARPYRVAIRAELSAIDGVKHLHEVDFVILQVARFGARCHHEEDHAEGRHAEIEEDCPEVENYKVMSS